MRLTKIQDGDSQVLWFSPEINHGDWPFRFAVWLQYLEDYGVEVMQGVGGKYMVEIHAVSPVAAGEEKVLDVANSYDLDWEALGNLPRYEFLLEYGISAPLWSKAGNNRGKLLTEARKELVTIDMLFGFRMDRPLNMIGSTGWDFIKGEITALYAGKPQ